ncbi:MAG TPA: type II toxin-antitoxin system RelB/DinJ family antitoxin [Candidatus Paceibacterota bacterium]
MDTLRSSYINARIEPKLKASAHRALKKVGLTPSDAITLFLHQVVLHQGLPFDVRVPNAETMKAIKEMRTASQRKKLPTATTSEAMLKRILDKKRKKAA